MACCVPADPASKDRSENAVKIAKADLVPTEANLLPDYAGFAELEALSWRIRTRSRLSWDSPVDVSASDHTASLSRSRMQASICSRSDGVRQNIAKCAQRLSTTRNSLFAMSLCSASQSRVGRTCHGRTPPRWVFAVIRPSAAARSPPVCRETSPCRHFQPIQIRLFGSIGRK